MRFIADAMLGRLARWLRFMGFDTLYYADISDRELLRLAARQGRFILTRDTGFRARGVKDCMIVASDHVEEQLAQVVGGLGLVPPGIGRCVACNGALEEVAHKGEVRDAVPEYVYMNFARFFRCAECGKVYWEGSHFKNFTEEVNGIIDSDEV